ncbi:MAG: response regulator [Alphaproteobacteria bacterium]|nr:response regulator [Alphaproteobacteria bacterium]
MAKILLAEDDESMLNFLVMALSRAGHDVHSCSDGEEALVLLDKEENFDLLLTDVVMSGIDGIELAEKATEKFPALKVMFITGFAGVAIKKVEESKTESINADNMLSKPFHLNDLIEQVETLLAS